MPRLLFEFINEICTLLFENEYSEDEVSEDDLKMKTQVRELVQNKLIFKAVELVFKGIYKFYKVFP